MERSENLRDITEPSAAATNEPSIDASSGDNVVQEVENPSGLEEKNVSDVNTDSTEANISLEYTTLQGLGNNPLGDTAVPEIVDNPLGDNAEAGEDNPLGENVQQEGAENPLEENVQEEVDNPHGDNAEPEGDYNPLGDNVEPDGADTPLEDNVEPEEVDYPLGENVQQEGIGNPIGDNVEPEGDYNPLGDNVEQEGADNLIEDNVDLEEVENPTGDNEEPEGTGNPLEGIEEPEMADNPLGNLESDETDSSLVDNVDQYFVDIRSVGGREQEQSNERQGSGSRNDGNPDNSITRVDNLTLRAVSVLIQQINDERRNYTRINELMSQLIEIPGDHRRPLQRFRRYAAAIDRISGRIARRQETCTRVLLEINSRGDGQDEFERTDRIEILREEYRHQDMENEEPVSEFASHIIEESFSEARLIPTFSEAHLVPSFTATYLIMLILLFFTTFLANLRAIYRRYRRN